MEVAGISTMWGNCRMRKPCMNRWRIESGDWDSSESQRASGGRLENGQSGESMTNQI